MLDFTTPAQVQPKTHRRHKSLLVRIAGLDLTFFGHVTSITFEWDAPSQERLLHPLVPSAVT